ncbi:hypothetical protein GCM10007386_32400 [Pseudoduganella dura]|nr:hypothetical protein GCM10007386_32400 [Pseudoduganella dura]
MATAANSSADAAASSAGNAATSAGQAEIFANAASVSAGVPLWVSGTNYVVSPTPSVVADPNDFRTYRRRVAGAGSIVPSLDPTNWQVISAGAYPLLHVRDEKPSGTGGGAAFLDATQTRTLNTVKTNSIPGASLSASQISLPAGRYRIHGRAPALLGGRMQAFLWNVTDSSYALRGSSELAASGASSASTICGELEISTTKVFSLRHYTASPSSDTTALGGPVSSGLGEVYSELFVEKVS